MPFRVALVASELAPFAKTGGLGDVTAALARYLHAAGHDVRPFLPLYGSLKLSGKTLVPVEFLQRVPVALGTRRLMFSVSTASLPSSACPVYFVSCPEMYDRPGIYSNHGDEHLRYALLSHAALMSCQRMGFAPDVVHCHDWHTALIPLWLRTVYAWDQRFSRTRTVLTIHNLAYQGAVPSSAIPDLSLAGYERLLYQEDLRQGRVRFLANGILHADAVTTVSATYAREILEADHGWGLDPLLRVRGDRLLGIVNGIDADLWNPASDSNIASRYDASDLAGKAACRRALLEDMRVAPDPKGPVFGVVSRLSAQKGLDLIPPAIEATLERDDARLLVMGRGSHAIADRLWALEHRHPKKVTFHHGFDQAREHRILAGSDVFLMPSLFEPCGLPQMYSLAYGTVPIVRKTGGLADTVAIYDPDTGLGTGIVFDHSTVAGLRWAIETSARLFRDRPVWRSMQVQGMAQDNSWTRRIHEYEALYGRLCGT